MDRQLLEYLPAFLQSVREYKAICQSEQPQVEALWQGAQEAMADQFIPTATENGVKRWEKILHITPKATDTLEERRFRILTCINQQTPHTITALRQQLEALCGKEGYTAQCDNNSYTLTVRVALSQKSNYDAVADLLDRVVPANIVIDLSLLYNQHQSLKGYTHGQLKAYTHSQLKTEEMSA